MAGSTEQQGILSTAPLKQIVMPKAVSATEDVGVGGGEKSCTGDVEDVTRGEDEETSPVEPQEEKGTDKVAPEAPQPTDDATQKSDESIGLEEATSGKKVSFSTLEIREYPICVGDNPAVTVGVPITIDWAHDGEFTCSVEEYEEHRSNPRTMIELRMPSRCRADMLRRLGFSRQDIMQGTKSANIARNRRKRTIELLRLSLVFETIEMTKRATLNATFRRTTKKKERAFLSTFASGTKGKHPRLSLSTAPLDQSYQLH